MSHPVGLDLDLLRSFVAIAEEKSFTRAAERVGRTQSAVSLQVQRLESVVGKVLLARSKGGGVELTPQGQLLLARARSLLELNDDIVNDIRGAPVRGSVTLGVADELSQRYLPRILQDYARVAPGVEVQVISSGSCGLSPQLVSGKLDVALLEAGLEPRQWPAREVGRSRLMWVTSSLYKQHEDDPLPLAVSPPDCPWRPTWMNECLWRGMTLRALEHAGRRYRIAATSGTTAGQLAAVQAGLAVTGTLVNDRLPEGVRVVEPGEGLPELPETAFLLLRSRHPRRPETDLLEEVVLRQFGFENTAETAA